MRKSLTAIGVAAVLWVVAAWLPESVQAAAVGVTLDQCRNATSGLGDCTGSAWVTGDLNPQNSLYREGDFVPFRSQVTGLEAGATYTLRIAYDAVESSLHAYDYVGSYNGSEGFGTQQIIPCDGVAGTSGTHACGSAPSTVAVPIDAATRIPSGSQNGGVFSAWGAKLTGAVYVQPSSITVSTTGTVERQIDLSFDADGDTVAISWGGHVASSLDWGQGETFVGSASGASFHMRVLQITQAGQAPTSTGKRDLSLHGSAIAPVPNTFLTQVSPQLVPIGGQVVETATLGGGGGTGPTGVVHFFLCFDATVAPDCSSGGTEVGHGDVVVAISALSSSGTASTGFVPAQTGRYCFRAEYEPDPVAPYSPALHTNTTTECFQATLAPPSLTVTKTCLPAGDSGLFNLLIDSVTLLLDGACGATTGPVTVSADTHTVAETAGTNTSLGDYEALIGGNCAPDGSVTLAAGESATCTITNTRLQAPPAAEATFTVNKLCQPADDGGLFDLYIDDVRFADVGCGGGTGAVTVPTGAHTVREGAGSGTSLDDYTTTIGGDCGADGSITLGNGAAAVCTITNTRKPPTPTTLRVNKLCRPAGDDGRFNLTVDNKTAGSGDDVGCGGTTGAVAVSRGLHTVGETGARNTDLADYQIVVGGDCFTDGSVSLQPGEQAVCTITNVRNDVKPQPALVTVNKICVPADDGGRFTLHVDGTSAANERCGGKLGPIAVSPGAHQVSETAGTGTRLSDYTTTIGGDCAADGSITLAAGASATCTITNSRPSEPTGTVEVKEICQPANAKAQFRFELDGQEFPNLNCGESSGPVETDTGRHLVEQPAENETAAEAAGEAPPPAPSPPAPFTPPEGSPTQPVIKTTIRGACDRQGIVRLRRGQHAVCLVVHHIRHVPRGPEPDPACYRFVVKHRTLVVGVQVTLVGQITLHGRPVQGAQIHLQGLGASRTLTTARNGAVRFELRFRRIGVVRLTTRRQFGCEKPPPKDAGVVAGTTSTPVTG